MARKKKKKANALIIILEVLIVLLFVIAGYLFYQYSKIKKATTSDFDTSSVTVDLPEEEEKIMEEGYINIALFGVDSRSDQLKEKTRSDSIIIVSINKKTKEIHLLSVYRDTVLYTNENHGYDKATHAYAYGGAELAVQTLNQNLDLNITEFATVNFNSLADIIDRLGGVEVELSQEEIDDMAEHGPETGRVVGREYVAPAAPGVQTLDGVQAVSYCRIRHVAGGDYKRSERQRIVLSQMFSKLKAAGPIKLAQIAQDVFPNVYTSMNLADILALIPGVSSYSIASSEGFPFETRDGRLEKMSVVYPAPNLYQNVIKLHEKLFGTEDYTPTSRVENYSIEIKALH